jgi:hypothetical protein
MFVFCICLSNLAIYRLQGAWHDGKGFEICTAGLEFKSGRASLIRVWDSRDFTRSPGPTK